MRILVAVLTTALLASVGSAAPSTPAVSNDSFVVLTSADQLYLLDKSGPAWFVFKLTASVHSVTFLRREPATGDAEFIIDGTHVLFRRFKGLLAFSPNAVFIARRPSFTLQAENKSIGAESWSLRETNAGIEITHASPEQVEHRYALTLRRP